MSELIFCNNIMVISFNEIIVQLFKEQQCIIRGFTKTIRTKQTTCTI